MSLDEAAGEVGGHEFISESSAPGALEPEATAGEASPASAGQDESQAEAAATRGVQPAAEVEKTSSVGDAGGENPAPPVAIAPPLSAALHSLEDALAALDRKDYATAKRLFEALGRKDAAEAIDAALAALDRKDYATAQGLFEALAPQKPAAPARPTPPAREPTPARMQPESKLAAALEIVPPPDAFGRAPALAPKKTKRGLRPLLRGAGLALVAIFIALAIYAPRPSFTLAAAKSQAVAGLASTVDLIKAPLAAVTGASEREQERLKVREMSAALAQATIRLNQIEQDYDARLDKLGERVDRDSSSRSAAISVKLDELEKKAAGSSALASELAGVAAKLDRLEKKVAASAAPAPEIAGLTARLDKLEKKLAAPAVSSAAPLPPRAPRPSTSKATAQPSADEVARLDSSRPLLRNYSVEDVQGGLAVIGSRYGEQQVAPGDVIPGAGRVLRIERRGGDWFVLTNRGVIASNPGPE